MNHSGTTIRLLICLLARIHSLFEFAFGLEPILQLTAWLFAAFKIDFVCATPDFLLRRGIPYLYLCRRRPGGGCLGLCPSNSLWFG